MAVSSFHITLDVGSISGYIYSFKSVSKGSKELQYSTEVAFKIRRIK